ncbi:hypothetical protein HanRHA438_Chr15g0716991 [Helianthus annuus]|nr:hypothetical protein HanHA300_Chr15g0574361 [Helianthus annuus]KAJ0694003.1 hypothetical protein HanPI659440_Chr15g0603811 [Helianthus annuus]KAJ0845737.1 hypothetical protein HanRHA438_Chr15g0716991 [Helianthus annuus]
MVLSGVVSKYPNCPPRNLLLSFGICHQMEVFLGACCMIRLRPEGFQVHRAQVVSRRRVGCILALGSSVFLVVTLILEWCHSNCCARCSCQVEGRTVSNLIRY